VLGLQKNQLFFPQEQKNLEKPAGNEKILPALPEAHPA